jgi:hypothetical protein
MTCRIMAWGHVGHRAWPSREGMQQLETETAIGLKA